MLGFGGTFSIESPSSYSPVAKGVIRDLGIDVSSYSRHLDNKVYPSFGLKQKIFFTRKPSAPIILLSSLPINAARTPRRPGKSSRPQRP